MATYRLFLAKGQRPDIQPVGRLSLAAVNTDRKDFRWNSATMENIVKTILLSWSVGHYRLPDR